MLSIFLDEDTALEKKKKLHRKNARKIKDTAINLKGLLIKIGQFMSSRVDVLPDEYILELSQLQDKIPPIDFSHIKKRLISELGKEPEVIFKDFNPTPIAAASLGQVHEAHMKSGEHVAVKVQYPHIERIVRADLRATKIACFLLSLQFENIRFDLIYREFARIVKEELNYIHEGKNSEKFHNMFKDDERIISPRIYWEHTTSRVLTMEFLSGIKISDTCQLRKKGIDLKGVASLIAECYLKQVLIHRFFHGDPHPGNIFVLDGPKLVFVDFGLVQHITHDMHQGIKMAIISIIDNDTDGIIRGLIDLGLLTWSRDLSEIREIVGFFMEKYRDMPPNEFRNITIDDVATDLTDIFRIHKSLQIPNSFILFGRVAGLLNGLCTSLDPDSNLIELAKPYAKNFVDIEKTLIEKALTVRKALSRLIYDIPEELYKLLAKANRGEMTTEMTSQDVTGMLGRIYTLGLKTITLISTFGFIFLYIYLRQKGYNTEALLAGGVSILLTAILILEMIFRK